jgi:hypothetical protein
MSSQLPLNQLGTYSDATPYYPYPAALERGIMDRQSSPSVNILPQSPGIELSAGRIPNHKQAGLLPISHGKWAALDHAAMEQHGTEVEIKPTSKRSVSHEGYIDDEGVITLGTEEGRIRIVAFAINGLKRPWLVDRFSENIYLRQLLREVIVLPADVLELPEYEITAVDKDTGILEASPRRRFY